MSFSISRRRDLTPCWSKIVKGANIYLNFDGNCREAMTFYGKCLEADPNFTPFSAGPPEMPAVAKTAPDRILHAELASGPVVLMASDILPGIPFQQGNNFSICIDCETQPGNGEALRRAERKRQGHNAIARRILGWPLRYAYGSIRYQLDVQFARTLPISLTKRRQSDLCNARLAFRDATLLHYPVTLTLMATHHFQPTHYHTAIGSHKPVLRIGFFDNVAATT